MLRETNYAEPDAKLSEKIARKNNRKEWSYFYVSIIKIFSGKISNFDDIITVLQELAYEILYNHFHNIDALILNEIGCKLGKKRD